MDDSFKDLIFFAVPPLPETAMGVIRNCLGGALLYIDPTVGDTILRFLRGKGSPPRTNDLPL